jgi:ribosomal protein S18 acetylase RimI-like enzyme
MILERRTATSSDTAFARSAHHEAFRDVVSRQFGEWDEALQDRLFGEKWIPNQFEIVLCDGNPCGFLSIEDHPDHIYVNEIVLAPQFQGRGIGSRLLNEAMQRGRETRSPLRLQVLRENRAIELYRRLGFKECGATERHIRMVWEAL